MPRSGGTTVRESAESNPTSTAAVSLYSNEGMIRTSLSTSCFHQLCRSPAPGSYGDTTMRSGAAP